MGMRGKCGRPSPKGLMAREDSVATLCQPEMVSRTISYLVPGYTEEHSLITSKSFHE